MRRRIFLGAAIAAIIGLGVYGWLTSATGISAQSLPAHTPNPANGIVVFNAGGCASCHAVPNQPDRLKLGGGLAIPSPFGTFYAPNISPDEKDGIGRWTEAEFVTAVTEVSRLAERIIFPPFPTRPTPMPKLRTSGISSLT